MNPAITMRRLAEFTPGRILALLRERTDLSSETGRSRERHRQIALAGLTAALVRAVSVLTALITVPLTLGYLGAERFGMWATLSSFNALLSFTDFGFGNAMTTGVAGSSARADTVHLRRLVATAYFALSGVAAAMLAAVAMADRWVDWAAVFAVTSPLAEAEAAPAAAAFIALMALANPIGVIVRVQTGLQLQWRANLWLLVGNLAALLAVLGAIALHAGLVWLVLALVGSPLLFQLGNTIEFIGRKRADLRPRFADFDLAQFRRLAGSGVQFMILQLCAGIIFQSSNLIVAQVLGASEVARFAVPDRLFGFVPMILAFALSPLWPAYGEAAARGDHAWVRQTFRRSLLLTVAAASVLSGGLLLAAPLLLRWWVGPGFHAPFALLAALAAWRVVEAVGHAGAMLLNGLDRIGAQVAGATLGAITAVGLRIWFTQRFGVTGAAVGGIVAYLAINLPILALAVRGALRDCAPHDNPART